MRMEEFLKRKFAMSTGNSMPHNRRKEEERIFWQREAAGFNFVWASPGSEKRGEAQWGGLVVVVGKGLRK